MIKIRRMLTIAISVVIAGAGILTVQTPAQAAQNCPTPVSAGQYKCVYEPTVITWPDGHRQYFVVGSDWNVYSNHELPGGSWSGWYWLDGVAHSRIWVTNFSSTTISINVIGTTGKAYVKTWRAGSGWTGWQYNGDPPVQRVVAGSNVGWRIYIYDLTLVPWPDGHYQYLVVGTDLAVYESHQLESGGTYWTPWTRLGGTAHSQVVYWPPNDGVGFYMFVIGNDGRTYYSRWDKYTGGGSWYLDANDDI